MEKEFVPYELAVKLKALGFDEPCFAFYICKGHPVMIDEIRNGKCFDSDESEGCLAPTFSQTFRWFREKYAIEIAVSCFYNNRLGIPYEERQYHCHIVRDGITTKGPRFDSHEKAELACLDKLIEIVESK